MSVARFAIATSTLVAALGTAPVAAQDAPRASLVAPPGQMVQVPADGTTVLKFDVAGIESNGEYRTPDNPTFTLAVPAGHRFIGIGWEVSLTAFAPSWLSDAAASFRNSTESLFDRGEFVLNPGFQERVPGTGTFSSGGIRDLVELELDFTINPDGQLIIEFSEDQDDPEVAIDTRWESGTITMVFAPVPEVPAYALMALGLLGMGVVARRNR